MRELDKFWMRLSPTQRTSGSPSLASLINLWCWEEKRDQLTTELISTVKCLTIISHRPSPCWSSPSLPTDDVISDNVLFQPSVPVTSWECLSLSSHQPPVQDILLSALVVAPQCQATYASHQLISSDWWLGGVGCRLLGGNFLSFHGSIPYSDSSVRTEMTGAGRHAGLLTVRAWHLMDFVFYKKLKKYNL